MSRRRTPPETRRLRYAEASLWELCAALGALPRRQLPGWWLAQTRAERRAVARERALLEATRVRYALPAAGRPGAPPQLSLLGARQAHLRVDRRTGAVARWRYVRPREAGRAPPGWRWAPALQQPRWLRTLAAGLALAARADPAQDQPAPAPVQIPLW